MILSFTANPACILDRKSYLAGAKLIIIKIGSAVLADADGLDVNVMKSLAFQIAAVRQALPGRKIVLVSSGAVAAGRGALAAAGRSATGVSRSVKQALAAIGQGHLVHAWNDAFAGYGILTAQILLTRDDFHWRERFQHAADTFAQMLAWDILPIVNENDTVAVHELQFGDNDTLASLLVNMVEADLFINLTSAAGVMSANPESEPDAPILEQIDNIHGLDLEGLCGSKTVLGSGGMYSKLLAARRVAQLGIPTLILPGRKPDSLLHAFNLSAHVSHPWGTWICPDERIIPRRKYWLAYQSNPLGALGIDSGAASALLDGGGSLLPGGIISVDGEFKKGDLVSIRHENRLLGVGFSNYDSDILSEIAGKKRHEIAAILGESRYPDAIHRDNLLLDAAIPG